MDVLGGKTKIYMVNLPCSFETPEPLTYSGEQRCVRVGTEGIEVKLHE